MERRKDKLTALYIDAVLNGLSGFGRSVCFQALLDIGVTRDTAHRLVEREAVRRTASTPAQVE